MIRHAREHGVKPAAVVFHTTPKTVRKWRDRYDGTLDSLADQSRRPNRSPNKTAGDEEDRIAAIKQRHPRWSPRRLRETFDLPWSEKVIRRVCTQRGLNRRYRRKKHETKRCLRAIKKQWRFLQQISVDTKDLSDIPEYWLPMKHQGLPRYQYTARDVSTGFLFLGYSDQLGLACATLFAERICAHLQACGYDLSRTTWQSDNGSEFVGSWQSKHASHFTRAIEAVPGQTHRTIPPGQHRFQADVETVHGLMEPEFYEIERFAGRDDFRSKADAYQLYFNVARRNSYKENRTPWELLQQKHRQTNSKPPKLELPMLPVVYLDELHAKRLHNPAAGGYHVRALP
jgi:hypothetical protein